LYTFSAGRSWENELEEKKTRYRMFALSHACQRSPRLFVSLRATIVARPNTSAIPRRTCSLLAVARDAAERAAVAVLPVFMELCPGHGRRRVKLRTVESACRRLACSGAMAGHAHKSSATDTNAQWILGRWRSQLGLWGWVDRPSR
jgi:hypothetical protein